MKIVQDGRRSVFSRGQSGYSLLEMAIAILVIGVLAAPALALYGNYAKTQQRRTTLNNIQYVNDAIQNYRAIYGTYPCPAPLNVHRTIAGVPNAAYGAPADPANTPTQKGCTSTGPTINFTTPLAGTCSPGLGICIENQTLRPLPAGQIPAGYTQAELQRVIVGAVPFRLLQIDENKTYDGYGSRIVYAVTQSQIDLNAINNLNGMISIQSAQGQSLTNPADSGMFVVYSPGPSRVGGWPRDGVITARCTGAVGLDVQNCNAGFEGGAASANPVFVYAYENRVPGVNFYDDQMSYFSSHADPLWARTPANLDDIHDLTSASATIGIGTNANTPPGPTIGTALDIVATGTNSALLVYGTTGGDGKILADRICDENGNNCWDPSVIGGANAAGEGMLCPPGNKFMVGIAGGGPRCDFVRVRCSDPVNYVLMGFNATGAPVCGPPPVPLISGGCGVANGVTVSSAPTTGLCSAGLASAVGGTGPWNWSCTGSGGGANASCSAPAPLNGTCGPANGVAMSSAPTTGLCSAGLASAVGGTGPWNWSCAGSGGGTNASCSASAPLNGTCGSANGVAVSSAPTTGLCSAGAASAIGGIGPWSWSCAGSSGGTNASCSAAVLPPAVDGVCGASNGATVSTAPTTGLCAIGILNPGVSGSGPWTWGCSGSGGGTNASCSAAPPNTDSGGCGGTGPIQGDGIFPNLNLC